VALIERSNKFVERGDTDISRTLLGAAAVLINASGGEDACEQAFNLWCGRAQVAEKCGEMSQLITIAKRAHEVALKVYGLDHPVIGLALMNVGDAYLQAGRIAEAQEALVQAITLFELCAPAGGYTREYMNGLLGTARELQAKANNAVNAGA
jgi:hypothetical protein